jgi:[glutamine synthetase] adenylyltransferase / [glutamine synthetase]-adenylyl-L-tyrosine phosphorylase
VEAAAAGEHRVGGQADGRAVRKQRSNRGNAVRVVRRSERRDHHQVGRYREIGVARGFHDIAAGDQPGRGDFDDLDSERLGPRLRFGINRGVGVVRPCAPGQREPVGRHEARQVVDMAVGVVVEQPVAEPQHAGEPEIARQPRLDLRARQLGIAVGVEQALLGRRHEAGAVAVDRAALEDPVGLGQRQARVARQFGPDRRVALHQVFSAPAVEARTQRGAVGADQRACVAQPDVAVRPPLERNRPRYEAARAGLVRRVAHQQPHRLPALGNRVGEGGDLLLRARQVSRPLVGIVREADPQPFLRSPLGRHGGGGAHRRRFGKRGRRRQACAGVGLSALTAAMAADWTSALARAREHAPFLARALERQPELAALLAAGDGAGALAWARAAGEGVDHAGRALRRERLALATALAIGDLAGAYPLATVTGELSDFADRALDAALAAVMRARVPDTAPAGIIALALGKQGARELNYSSDIDPILLYDPALLPRRARDEPAEAAQRYAREAVRLLSEVTPEGYVFRVDLRLRPASEVSPPAIPLEAALTHYESSALAWERAAFIKARAAAGDVAAGERFLAAIRPFVWRRSLDFGAIGDIRRLSVRIRASHAGPREPGPGFNVKLGRGGIREIEFFAQTHQLIHGGRDPSLRVRGTRAALDALATARIIAMDAARTLGEAYERLRTVEHRLQMIGDQQTHSLPGGDALDAVARLDGLADGAALLAGLGEVTASVGAYYDALIEEDERGPSAVVSGGDKLGRRLSELGFAEPDRLAERIAGWSDGRIRALRSEPARAALDALLPVLLERFAAAADPDQALNRWERVLGAAPSALNLFNLLLQRPALLDQLARILVLAPTLADELGRRPELLDTLIARRALDLPGTVDRIAGLMTAGEDGDDYERQLDRIRRVTGELRFALGLQTIAAAHDPLKIGTALSRTAEAALAVAQRAAVAEFERAHGRVAGSELVVLGLGRLGGGTLTHASDLDVVYLFSGAFEGESDGPRPLGVTHYFNRLAQRVTAALSVPTAEGALYEVDTRLRPQGAQGPLAVSFDSFARYQREEAWTWEHMALARARPLTGSAAARAELQAIIAEVLGRPRDPATLRGDVLRMRAEMAAHKPPRGPLDAKLQRGGLVDLEFLVHYLQLRDRVGFDPDLGRAVGALVDAGLVPAPLRESLALMTRLLVAGRLLAPDLAAPPPAAAAALAEACGMADLPALLRAFAAARQEVAAAWADSLGEPLGDVE